MLSICVADGSKGLEYVVAPDILDSTRVAPIETGAKCKALAAHYRSLSLLNLSWTIDHYRDISNSVSLSFGISRTPSQMQHYFWYVLSSSENRSTMIKGASDIDIEDK